MNKDAQYYSSIMTALLKSRQPELTVEQVNGILQETQKRLEAAQTTKEAEGGKPK